MYLVLFACLLQSPAVAKSDQALNTNLAHVLDLHTLPLAPQEPAYSKQHRTSLEYSVNGTVREVFDFHLHELKLRQWKTVKQDQPGTAILAKDGCYLSMRVHENTGALKHKLGRSVSVSIACLTAMDMTKLPRPKAGQVLTNDPWDVSMKIKGNNIEKVRQEIDQLFQSANWISQGGEHSQYYKQGFHLLIVSFDMTEDQDVFVSYKMHLQFANLSACTGGLWLLAGPDTLRVKHRGTLASLREQYVKSYEALGWKKHNGQDDKIVLELANHDRLEITLDDKETRSRDVNIVEARLKQLGWTVRGKEETSLGVELRLTNAHHDTMTMKLDRSSPQVEVSMKYLPASTK